MCVLYKTISFVIFAIVFMILALVESASLMHYFEVAVAKTSKIKSNIIDGTISVAGGGDSGSILGASPNSITSSELKAFSKCVATANKVQGLSRTIVTDCLDTSKGNTPANNSAATFSSNTASSPETATSINTKSLTSSELKTFSDCVDTARELQALSHAVVNGCLDKAEGMMR